MHPIYPPNDRTRTLKHGDTFAVFNCHGDISLEEQNFQGIFHKGTRFLSGQLLQIENIRPLLLSSTIKYENELLIVDLTNPNIPDEEEIIVPGNTIHLFRSKFLWNGTCRERLRIGNFGLDSVDLKVSMSYEADFVDIFEVRGAKRSIWGEKFPPMLNSDSIIFNYRGVDSIVRSTTIKLDPLPDKIEDCSPSYNIKLRPKEIQNFYITILCDSNSKHITKHKKIKPVKSISYERAWKKSKSELEFFEGLNCNISTSNEQFNNWLSRSYADLHMMLTRTKNGIYPYGGVPWFSTIFGRDGIITALQTLWINPEIGKGVLSNLVALQAKESDSIKEAQPGKIIHEKRDSEMAMIGDVPFKEYYGTIDATPLFVVLAGSYLEHTGDIAFIKSIWPNVEMALLWIDEHGDIDKDGFIEYLVNHSGGLRNQGWKDSHDSVFHNNGEMAGGSIALCEVQGYVYMAKIKASNIARVLGFNKKADKLLDEAETLKIIFNKVFWQDDISTYALALDGDKKPCRVVTSNPGHCLYSGIANDKNAKKLVDTLMSEKMLTPWGIRTLSSSEVRYNPMSYHNGSVWPHDNSIIASGMANYGFKDATLAILSSLYDASVFFELHRLPELYCGFKMREAGGPTLYPGACSPQAWAVGSIFLLLNSCLGMKINGLKNQISFCSPVLPQFVYQLEIKNLRIANSKIDIKIQRYANDVGINILKKADSVSVLIEK